MKLIKKLPFLFPPTSFVGVGKISQSPVNVIEHYIIVNPENRDYIIRENGQIQHPMANVIPILILIYFCIDGIFTDNFGGRNNTFKSIGFDSANQSRT